MDMLDMLHPNLYAGQWSLESQLVAKRPIDPDQRELECHVCGAHLDMAVSKQCNKSSAL